MWIVTKRASIALDNATLEAVNGAGLSDALGRNGGGMKAAIDKGIQSANYGGRIGHGLGGAIIGLVKGIKNEIFEA